MGALRGLLLSGGTGVRMRPFSFNSPKQLLPVANRPVLAYAAAEMAAAGVADLVVVTGAPEAAAVRTALTGLAADFLTIRYVVQAAPRGLADAVAVARPCLEDTPFLMQLGDNLVPGGARRLVQVFAAQDCTAAVLVAKVDDPGRYGVAVVDASGLVRRLVEKPQQCSEDLALVGVYAFRPEIFAAIAETVPSARGELEITDALDRLVERGYPVRAVQHPDWWCDVGTPDDLLQANRHLLAGLTAQLDGEVAGSRVQGAARVGPGSRLVGCTIQGPVLVGAGCELQDAALGPFVSIGDGARLCGCTLADSVVFPGAAVDRPGKPLTQTIIGRSARVTGGAAARLLLGDASWVEGI